MSNKELSRFLREKNNIGGIINFLKIVYRPYICPFNRLLTHIPEGSKILDIGCGQGQFALLLSEYCRPSKLKGIDINKQFIDEAGQLFSSLNYPDVIFEMYDGMNFPTDIGSFDYITMVDVFHHIPVKNQHAFVGNLYKCMAAGTRFLIKDIDRNSLFVYANRLHDIVIAGKAGHEMSRKDMRSLLKENGFKILDEGKKLSFWYPHYWFVLEK